MHKIFRISLEIRGRIPGAILNDALKEPLEGFLMEVLKDFLDESLTQPLFDAKLYSVAVDHGSSFRGSIF